ncbi:long-chain-fatty-acid--CoA ligase [Promicromonospora thailandica]|uniref:Fatty-acyl-CoA synthase n=1 Tax=Promicromonospora thailandica TaxID=765201 RepID=A0A9X2JWW4_9MICO|nr:long-chain-fatty-acid--CoA ligase [Promicromonospora thailandica]MCP2266566.1 fatty-acyl-CoA synthase [Promicromonospora thailandica]BFF17360.1 long-chain-fatty-acid--CoA ligase [Promicromonospora thailandica]
MAEQAALPGLMQERALEIGTLLRRAETMFAHKRVVTGTLTGETTATWGEVAARARRLSAALDLLDVPRSARVGSFAWNTQRHVELYLGVPSGGRVLHTLNHRLFADDLRHVLADAADDVVVVDRSLLPTVWTVVAEAPTVRWVVVTDDGADTPLPDDPRVLDYEDLIARVPHPAPPSAVRVAEGDAACLCYTSGTTGRPKGVLYSHRSVVLHALVLLGTDSFAVGERDVIMPVVPMFHVNGWGLPYAAALAGATLVLPGPDTAPAALVDRLERHRVTLTAGVPAVWRSLRPLLAGRDLSALRLVVSGGSALPDSLSQAWERDAGVPITGSWGMTETSPVVAVGRVPTARDGLAPDERRRLLGQPGPTVPLVDVRVVDPEGRPVLRDGATSGELQVAGPTIAAGYHGADPAGADSFTADGWLRTGDVATLDELGTVRIVDRTKDMIKSGGEWISSVTLENHLMDHPHVLEAAVVGVADERWGERPRAFVVLADDALDLPDDLPGIEAALREHLAGRVASWWVPDRFVVLDRIPRTATGKFSKVALRRHA